MVKLLSCYALLIPFVAWGAISMETTGTASASVSRESSPGVAEQAGETLFMAKVLLNPASVRRLLAQGASPHERDAAGNTPLHYCDYSTESARLLIEAGADVNARNHAGYTPLMMQKGVSQDGEECVYGVPMVKLLIQSGADMDARNNAGLSARDLAMTLASSWYGENPVLPLLQREGKSVSLHAQLVGAAAAGRVELCKSLLRQGAEPNALGRNAPNALASCLGNVIEPGERALELTEMLLQAGADPNLAATDIMSRCRFPSNREKILELLFRHGYDLAKVDAEVLRFNLEQEREWNGDSRFLQLLQKHGANDILRQTEPNEKPSNDCVSGSIRRCR